MTEIQPNVIPVMYYVLPWDALTEHEQKSFSPREQPVLQAIHAFRILSYSGPLRGGRQVSDDITSLPRALMQLRLRRRGLSRAALYAVRYLKFEVLLAHITESMAARIEHDTGPLVAPGKREL